MKQKILVIIILLAFVGTAQAVVAPPDYIKSISGSSVQTCFSSLCGTLSIDDTINITIEDESGWQDTLSGVDFNLTTILDSANGADAVFTGGSFEMSQANPGLLLAGNVTNMSFQSVADGWILAGSGMVTLDDGSLLGDIRPGYDEATTVQMIFNIPQGADFTDDFEGDTNFTITPIPEPATIGLLGIGFGALATIKRKRG